MIIKSKNSFNWLKIGGIAAIIDLLLVTCMAFFEHFLATTNLELLFYIIVMLPLFPLNYFLYPNNPLMGNSYLAYPTTLGMIVSVIEWFLIGAIFAVIANMIQDAKAQNVSAWRSYFGSYVVGALTVNQTILALCHIIMFLGIILGTSGKNVPALLFLKDSYPNLILLLSIVGGIYFIWHYARKLANYRIFEISKSRLRFNLYLTIGVIILIGVLRSHFIFDILEYFLLFLRCYPFTTILMYLREKPKKVCYKWLLILLLILTNPLFVIMSTSFFAFDLPYYFGL